MNPLISMIARQAVGNMPQTQMIQKFQQFRKGWTPESAQHMHTITINIANTISRFIPIPPFLW